MTLNKTEFFEALVQLYSAVNAILRSKGESGVVPKEINHYTLDGSRQISIERKTVPDFHLMLRLIQEDIQSIDEYIAITEVIEADDQIKGKTECYIQIPGAQFLFTKFDFFSSIIEQLLRENLEEVELQEVKELCTKTFDYYLSKESFDTGEIYFDYLSFTDSENHIDKDMVAENISSENYIKLLNSRTYFDALFGYDRPYPMRQFMSKLTFKYPRTVKYITPDEREDLPRKREAPTIMGRVLRFISALRLQTPYPVRTSSVFITHNYSPFNSFMSERIMPEVVSGKRIEIDEKSSQSIVDTYTTLSKVKTDQQVEIALRRLELVGTRNKVEDDLPPL